MNKPHKLAFALVLSAGALAGAGATAQAAGYPERPIRVSCHLHRAAPPTSSRAWSPSA